MEGRPAPMTLRPPLAALLAILLGCAASFAAGCAGRGGSTLTVYSAAGLADWYQPQFDAFTRETGIKVNLFEAGSGELVSRVNSRMVWDRLDGDSAVPAADLLVTLPPFIQKAARSGILQPSGVDTAGLSPGATDPGGLFVPIVNTALCFIVNPTATPQPKTWDDLLRPSLKGKLQYSTPGESGDGTAMLVLLQHLMGRQGALDYLARLQANTAGPASSTATLQPKVDSGEILVANGDVQMNLSSIRNDGSDFTIFFPAMADDTRTTVWVPYFAAVPAASPDPEGAKRLLAFLLSQKAQREAATQASGIPVLHSAATDAASETGVTPTTLLRGVRLWEPDWNVVLDELDGDLDAFKRATGG